MVDLFGPLSEGRTNAQAERLSAHEGHPLIRRRRISTPPRAWAAALLAVAAVSAVGATQAIAAPPKRAAAPGAADGLGAKDIYIEADQLIDNRDAKLVTAEGHVEARHLGRTLRADHLVYDTVTGVVTAHGHVAILNEDGTAEYGDDYTLDDSFRAGVALGFSARLQDNVTIIAGAAIKRTETVSELRNARYTPCKICKDDGVTPKTPSFQVQASNIIQDADHHVIYYKNAIIRVFGVPLFYAPVFWHPDPTAERRSGLLTPKLQYSKRRGFSYQQPYLFTLSPSSELIVAPQFNTKVNAFLGAEYAQRFYSGALDIRGGYGHDQIFDGRRKYGDNTNRSYILGHGRFNFDKAWDWGFGVERATDPSIFRRYGVQDVFSNRGLFPTDTDRLISQLFTTRTDSQSYLSLSAVSFQSLRIFGQDAATLPINESNRPFPAVAPLIEARYDPKADILGGRLRLRGSAVVLSRNNPVLNLVDPLGVVSPGPIRSTNALANPAAVPGLLYQDSRRATASADWRADWTLRNGIRLTPYAQVRGDVFSISDASLVTVQNGVSGTTFGAQVLSSAKADDTVTRGIATVGVSASWPFIRQTGAYTAILEPVAQAFVSPRLKRDLSIPNEDSVSFEFDESTLFSSNRSPGFDLSESGARVNVGGRATVFWGASSNASVLVGRTFRDSPDPAFLASSGVRDTASDWVVYAKVQPIQALTFFNRARLDANGFKVRREEIGLSFALIPRIALGASYNYNENGLVIGPTGAVSTGKTQDVDFAGTVFPFKHWGASALVVRDLENNIFPVQQLSLIYRDECIRFDLVYTHDQILGAAIGSSSSLSLRLTLATLGGTPLGYGRGDSR